MLLAAGLLAGAALAPSAARTARTGSADAQQQADAMLEDLSLPARAQRSEGEPAAAEGRLTASSGSHPTSPLTVHLHAYWTLSASVREVISWAMSHYRRGTSTLSQSGSAISLPSGAAGSLPGGTPRSVASGVESVGFGWQPRRGPIAQRFLDLSVTSGTGGLSVVRADVYVVPRLPRPAAERIPSAAGFVRITAQPSFEERHRHVSIPPILVTSASTVRAIAQAIDALPRLQPGVYNCPSGNASRIDFAFSAAAGGPVLARVQAEPTGCGTVEVWIGGRHEPALTNGYQLVRRVERLLGPLGERLPKPH